MADTPRINFAIAYAQYGAKAFPLHCILPDGQCSCGSNKCRDNPKGRSANREKLPADSSRIRHWRRLNSAALTCGTETLL
jgi:hypothetical protein